MECRLTPFNLFKHYAKLRGHKDPDFVSEEIIKQLNIEKCKDTVIGDNFVRGISGGEKKRCSIGIELVSNPNLLFLDEPTTGLDSSTALEII